MVLEPSAHLKREVPKANYSTTPEWVQAVKREVDEVLLPRAGAEMDGPDSLAAKAAEFITTDRILEDLALEERLDAMVDRAMRRLAQNKSPDHARGSCKTRPRCRSKDRRSQNTGRTKSSCWLIYSYKVHIPPIKVVKILKYD